MVLVTLGFEPEGIILSDTGVEPVVRLSGGVLARSGDDESEFVWELV